MQFAPDPDFCSVEVEISSLSIGGSPRSSGESREHVELLAAATGPLPPIVVHRPTMRVIDGMHRLRAAQLCGRRTIPARFFDGPEGDAFVLSVRLNVAHGLPLSLTDRKSAAEKIIESHPDWSDRLIASTTGLSAKTISELRRRTAPESPCVARIGRDGRVRSINRVSGRTLAYDLMTKDPSLSFRHIARIAGISPETVRDVRKRMYRGESPVPAGRHNRAVPDEPPSIGPADRPAARRALEQPPAAIVDRLKADPALRLNENGRDLLRLLNIHTIPREDWLKIVDSIPPHCAEIIVQLARGCAEGWRECATRLERKMSKTT